MRGFLLSPYGRISRRTYWLHWILPYLGVSIVALALDYALFPLDSVTGDPQEVLQRVVTLALFWPSIALTTKRLHDRGMTGWWNLAIYVAVIAVAILTYYYFTTSMRNPGTDPFASPVTKINGLLVVSVSAWVILYPTIQSLFFKGQSGANKYGPDPMGDPADVFQ